MKKIYALRNTNIRIFIAILVLSFFLITPSQAQFIIARETFPIEFNRTLIVGPGAPAVQEDSVWQLGASDAEASIAVIDSGSLYTSSPYSLGLVNYPNNNDLSQSYAFSPIIDLSSNAGSSAINIGFSLNASNLDPANTCLTYNVQVYNLLFGAFTVFSKTAAQMVADYGTSWDTVMINIPLNYLTNDFKFVIYGENGPDCNTFGNEILFVDDVIVFNLALLPVTLRSFNVNYANKTATLKWTVSEETSIESYTIERSRDGRNFEAVGRVTANNSTSYQYADNLSNFSGNALLYRLLIKEATGAKKYSNIVSLRLNSIGKGIQLSPNPARSSTTVRIIAAKQGDATIRLMNMGGKTVRTQIQKVLSGVNSIQLSNLETLQSGLYNVQVILDGEIFVEKLIINK
jgi:type IX secretion system substrate protein